MMGGWAVGWVWVWPVLVVASLLIIGYVVVRVAQGGRQPSSLTGSDSGGAAARRILDERFAHGEIDDEEYRRRRDLLP
jgi:putative membrane protein